VLAEIQFHIKDAVIYLFFLHWVWWWFVCHVTRSTSQSLKWRIYKFMYPALSY